MGKIIGRIVFDVNKVPCIDTREQTDSGCDAKKQSLYKSAVDCSVVDKFRLRLLPTPSSSANSTLGRVIHMHCHRFISCLYWYGKSSLSFRPFKLQHASEVPVRDSWDLCKGLIVYISNSAILFLTTTTILLTSSSLPISSSWFVIQGPLASIPHLLVPAPVFVAHRHPRSVLIWRTPNYISFACIDTANVLHFWFVLIQWI